jgi:hypothetical protein
MSPHGRNAPKDVLRVRGQQPAEADGVARWAAWAGAVADQLDPIARLRFGPDGGVSLAPAAPDGDLQTPSESVDA